MSGQAQFSVPCSICGKPVDLTAKAKADESGKPVHENCYVMQVTGAKVPTKEASQLS